MGAYSGDGRTMTVAHLGMALAELGSRVVVIDSDFRKDDLAGLLQMKTEGAIGLISSPDADANYEAGLMLIRMNWTDSPLQAKDSAFPALLGNLRPLADFVLLDSPPCGTHADAFFLAPLVDGVLYVVRERNQNVEEQRGVQAQLARLGATTLGVIFNEGPQQGRLNWFKRRIQGS
jgi:Mrp family chromosome partitioning ATPase